MEIKQTYSPVIRYIGESSIDSYSVDSQELTFLRDEESIKKYYGDQNYNIRSYIFERSVKFEDNKLTLKINRFLKTRSKGKKYFRKQFDSSFLRFDLSTGNFTTVFSGGKCKKTRSSIIRTNSFFKLQDFTYSSNYFEPNGFIQTDFLREDAGDVFDNGVIIDFIEYHLKCKVRPLRESLSNVGPTIQINTNKSYISHLLHEELVKQFITHKGIKTPDTNSYYWLTAFYPTEKFLKKNDRKLIQSVLDMLGINSKYTNKIFHNFTGIDVRYFILVYELLGGTKHMSALSNSFYTKLNQKERDPYRGGPTKYAFVGGPDLTKYSLTPFEKKNLIKLLNSEGKLIDLIELNDHFDMIKKIRLVDPSVQLRSANPIDFRREHFQLSEMIRHLKKGITLSYVFDDQMVSDIEKPIKGGITFHPYILKREDEYFEEGKVMHHCVGSYYDKNKSIIISLRTEDGDRVTCEYNVDNGVLIQAKYKCNAEPPKHFYKAIYNELNLRCRNWATSKKLKSVETIQEPIKFNGLKLTKENNPLWEERNMWLLF